MASFYNAPKDGEKFSSIAVLDWENVNSVLDLTEFRFASNDDYYFIFSICDRATDVIKSGDKDWKFPQGEKLLIKIARRAVKRKKDGEPVWHDVEKFVCSRLEKLDPTKAYAGQITLQNSGFVKMVVTGADASGKPITEAQEEMFASGLFSATEREIENIPDGDMVIPKAAFYGGGAKAQTELEKLGDRLTFIQAQLKAAGLDYEVKSVADISSAVITEKLGKDKTAASTIINIIDSSLLLMFGIRLN
jgi:hypothetical protein